MKYNHKLGLVCVFILLLGWTFPSWASEDLALTPAGCATVASILEAVSSERQNLSYEEQVASLDAVPNIPPPVVKLLKKHIYLIYKVYPQLPPAQVGQSFFLECYKYEGNINKLAENGTRT